MELCPHPLLAMLFLGIILGNILQIIAHENQVLCNNTEYLNYEISKCCSRCPPGFYSKEKCTRSTDTLCAPCQNGTFTAKWNYASTCRTCYPCSQNLVEIEPCSATHATDCGCPEGYVCSLTDAIGVCQICEPGFYSEPVPTESLPEMKTIWIIVGVVLLIVTSILVITCLKTSLLKNFGHMIKNKRCSESFPQAETTVDVNIELAGAVRRDQASSLLIAGPIKTPFQEEGKHLNFPIQETDANQTGELSLLSTRVE